MLNHRFLQVMSVLIVLLNRYLQPNNLQVLVNELENKRLHRYVHPRDTYNNLDFKNCLI